MTRWEKFAKEKGIVKRKRERMVFDEKKNEFAPRWGYKRANEGDLNDWAIPVKPGDDPFEDAFAKRKIAKKERVLKNKSQQLKNLVIPLSIYVIFSLPLIGHMCICSIL